MREISSARIPDRAVILVLIAATCLLPGCTTPQRTPRPSPSIPVPDVPPEPAPAPAPDTPDPEKNETEGREGMASYYGERFAGELTASGERFNPSELTAAHRTLPFGTRVRVTNLDNGARVVVRINDRGPFAPGRIIDLSRRAAEKLGMIESGVARVRLQVLD